MMAQLPISTIIHQTPPDQVSVHRFLKALDPNTKSFLFIIIKTGGTPKALRSALTQQLFASLSHANSQGYNVYVTVNETGGAQGTTRTRDTVTRFTAVFADDDGKTVAKPYPLEPSAVIETSPGKKQVYWFIDSQPPNVDEWDGVQQTIVNEYAGDPNSRDAARILRIPGFYNSKPEYSPPPRVRILSVSDKRYSWDQIVAAFPPSPIVTSTGGVKGEAIDLRAVLEQAATGSNYHNANITLAGWYYNTGVTDRDKLINLLQAQIDVFGNPADARFDHRRNVDIPTSVDWVLKKRGEEQVPATLSFSEEPTTTRKYTKLPMPGGGLYRIVQWVRSTMRYPNDSIALIVAEHLVSVFGGGHYHIMNNTTTRKRIALAPLASGKNTITRCMGLVIRGLGTLNGEGVPWVLEADKFVGSDSFSFSVQHKQLEEHRVRSFIVNEAGESGRSQAGDIGNLRAYQLQALSTKADEPFFPKKFSEQGKGQESKQLQTVFNAVWVYFHESTIKSYAQMLQESAAFVNGDLSRSDIFFIDPTIHSTNHDAQGITPDMLVYFANMANDFRKLPGHQGNTDHAVWEEVDYIEIKPQLDALEREIVQARNRAYGEDNDVETALLGRRYERILTSILICAIADAGGVDIPVARKCHYDYAVARADAIDDALRYHSRGSGDLGSDVFQTMQEHFVKRFKHTIKTKSKNKLALAKLRMSKQSPIPGTVPNPGKYWCIRLETLDMVVRGSKFDAIKELYRGDTALARRKMMQDFTDRGLVHLRMEKVSTNEFKPKTPMQWWLDNMMFKAD